MGNCPWLSEATVERLACPCCMTSLTRATNSLECRNPNCRSSFPLVDGIPILIDEAISVFSISDFTSRRDTFFPARSKLVQLLRRLIPSISLNLKARKNYRAFAELLLRSDARPKVLVIGGSITGGGMDDLLRTSEIEFVESDVSFGPRTAIVLDGHKIPFLDQSFDGVVAQAVLEHVIDPQVVVDEMHRILKPDGVVYAETPFMQQVHAGAYDFTRFTHLGHRHLFRGFQEISSGAVGGAGMALAWSYKYFLMSFTNNPLLRKFLGVVAECTSFFLKYVDYLTIDNPASLDAASGVFFLGRKSATALSDRELIKGYRGAGRAADPVALELKHTSPDSPARPGIPTQ